VAPLGRPEETGRSRIHWASPGRRPASRLAFDRSAGSRNGPTSAGRTTRAMVLGLRWQSRRAPTRRVGGVGRRWPARSTCGAGADARRAPGSGPLGLSSPSLVCPMSDQVVQFAQAPSRGRPVHLHRRNSAHRRPGKGRALHGDGRPAILSVGARNGDADRARPYLA
jgi:hypothetical protein